MDIKCEFCNKFPATKKCNSCIGHKLYCTKCFTELHHTPEMQMHNFSIISGTKIVVKNCLVHPSFPLKAVCITCSNMLICAECIAFGEHKGHTYSLIDFNENQTKLSLEQVREMIIRKKENLYKEFAEHKTKFGGPFQALKSAVAISEGEWNEKINKEQKRIQNEFEISISLLKMVEKNLKTGENQQYMGCGIADLVQSDLQEIYRKICALEICVPPIYTDLISEKLEELKEVNGKSLTPCIFSVQIKSRICRIYTLNTKKSMNFKLPIAPPEKSSYIMNQNNGEIYFVGGFSSILVKPVGNTMVFNINRSEVIKKSEISIPRFRIGLYCFYDKFIYAIGGECENNNFCSCCDRFDISTNMWIGIPDLLESQADCTIFQMTNILYVIGGLRHGAVCSEKIEYLDTLNEQAGWNNIEIECPDNFWLPITGCFAISINDTESIIFGGWKGNYKNTVFKVEKLPKIDSKLKITLKDEKMPKSAAFNNTGNFVKSNDFVYGVDAVNKNIFEYNIKTAEFNIIEKTNWLNNNS